MVGWICYIVRCRDGTLYTGVTTDLDRRIAAHNAGRGAAYTKGRRPVVLVHREDCPDRSSALRREAALKRGGREGKLALIRGRRTVCDSSPQAPIEKKPRI